MIDRDTINRIMDATNIVEVISDFMTLRRAGSNFKGLCPFHNEKTPSFMVSPSKGIYHCFGCGRGGDTIRFIMEHEQMNYPEALHWLADKYHIRIEERELTDEEKQKQSRRESVFIVNEWAAKYFQDILHNDIDGRSLGLSYFRNRGFRDDIIERFRLGYALPERTALCNKALKEGFKKEFLKESGLCGEREDGTMYDRFSGRVIFPWFGISGKVVAFGGRLLDSRTKGVTQKYINSPESDIYHKDHELYGIFQAKRAIVKEDKVYMVEGYTDVLSMHQCGVENVVANSGTALSVHQVHLLHRFTQNIVLLYDGDAAGIHAALRGSDILLEEGMNVKVLLFPDGNDPDSFLREKGAEAFRNYIENNQVDFIQFKAHLLLKESEKDPIKRASLIKSMVQSISVIPDAITRSVYIQECSRSMNVDERLLTHEVSQTRYSRRKEKNSSNKEETPNVAVLQPESSEAPQEQSMQSDATERTQKTSPLVQKERMLVRAIIRYGDRKIGGGASDDNSAPKVVECIHDVLEADSLKFEDAMCRKIFDDAYAHRNDAEFECPRYFLNHPDVQISGEAVQMVTDRYQLSKLYRQTNVVKNDSDEKVEEIIPHLIQEYRLAYVQQKIKEIQMRMTSLGSQDNNELLELMKQLVNWKKLEQMLAKQVGERVVM